MDDEPAVIQAFKRLLAQAGYQVTAHASPLAAFADFIARPTDFQIIWTDLTMPGLTGLELAAKVREIRPDLPVVIATGFAGNRIAPAQRAEHPNIRQVVEKPFNPNDLPRLIGNLLRKPAA